MNAMKNAMKKLQESKKIIKESYSFQEIIDMMEEADTYSELNTAAEYINDPKLREEVLQEIETCREDGDEVSVAYSVVTSDLLDSMVNEVNEAKEIKTEARDRIAETIGKFIYDLGDEAWSYTGEAFNNLGQKLYTINKNGQEKLGHNEIAKAVLKEYPELLVMLDVGNCIVFGKRDELNKMEKEPEVEESLKEGKYEDGLHSHFEDGPINWKDWPVVDKDDYELWDDCIYDSLEDAKEASEVFTNNYCDTKIVHKYGKYYLLRKAFSSDEREYGKEEIIEESLKENITLVNSNGVKFDEKELRKNWEEELKNDLEDGESLEEYKKKVPFEKWIENLLDTGDYKKLEESEVITEKYPADGTYTEEERDAYYERTKKRVQEYADNLDLTPLFNWLKEITGINDLTFEVKKDTDAGKPRLNWESNNIVDKIGVMKFAFKDVRLESFGNGVTTTAPDYYDSEVIDFNKDYDVYYWCSVHFGYEHIDGGTNGASIGKAVCKEGKWSFSLDTERYKNR